MGVFRQFPYSNFHEMNMDDIIKIVKNMLEEWAQYHAEWDNWMNQMNDDWSNYQEVMNEAWQNMQNFINNYFDNLDVQEEINTKITSMVNSGEFDAIVEPYIPPRVTAWLTEHITQPVGVVIDTSLTVSGACADAKATGDAIKSVDEELNPIINLSLGTWTDGYYINRTTADGVILVEDANYSVSDYIFIPRGVTVKVRTFMSSIAKLIIFDSNKDYISYESNSSGETYGEYITLIDPAETDRYIRFSCYQPNKNYAYTHITNNLSDIIGTLSDIETYDISYLLDLDIEDWTDDYYLNRTSVDGVILVPNTNYSVSDFVFIPSGVSVEVRTFMSGIAKLIIFDADKEFISYESNTSGETYGEYITVIESANADRYIRFSCYQPNKDYAYIHIANNLSDTINAGEIFNRLGVSAFGSRISSDSALPSLADATPNTVYTITNRIDETQPATAGTMLTLNATKDNNGGHVQIFVTTDNDVYTRIKWSRSGGVIFSPWKHLANDVNRNQFTDLAMCMKIGVIGDSFASGVIYPSNYVSGDEENYTHYEQSWGQCLARLCGNTVVNYSAGGMTTRSWLTNQTYGKGKFDNDTACDLYILCLGINDSNTSMGNYLGTDADIETEADTFYGNYAKIIRLIQTKSATARIVMSTYCRRPTPATEANYDAFNEAIENIANAFNIPCIVLTDDDFFNSTFYLNGMQNAHPTAPQYSGYAKAINRLISLDMVTNYQYWSNYNSTPSS